MKMNVLVTGGAGFIGSHLVDELLAAGCNVRVLDNLLPQVHGQNGNRPNYLSDEAELVVGDICSISMVKRCLKGMDAVFHLAARVGVGQSMYRVRDYIGVNDLGTANILEALTKTPVGKFVVASSMSIYGEGLCIDSAGRKVNPNNRTVMQMKQAQWELMDDRERRLTPVNTPESKTPNLASVYALSKYSQEQMCLLIGKAYDIPTVALRFFNVYGPRQALSNPYTGVLAIFAARLLNDKKPVLFEDGLQRRDFVHVGDVARACKSALESADASGHAVNVGSGKNYTILEIGSKLARLLGREHLLPEISGRFRFGDVRHCFADISKAQKLLNFQAEVTLEQGLAESAQWLDGKHATDHWEKAGLELKCRGLAQ